MVGLQDDVAKYVTQQVYRLSDQKDGIEVLEVNVQVDHVHMVVTIPPKYAVSQYMGFLKGKLALRLFDRFPELRKRYWGQHVWSRGYCVSTVGLNEDRIRKYVNYHRQSRWLVENAPRRCDLTGTCANHLSPDPHVLHHFS